MPRETYHAARTRLMAELRARNGWRASRRFPELLTPWAESPAGDRIEFHPQAVYLNRYSMFLDYRGMTLDTLLEYVAARKGRS